MLALGVYLGAVSLGSYTLRPQEKSELVTFATNDASFPS
jgi:hypothetical protein